MFLIVNKISSFVLFCLRNYHFVLLYNIYFSNVWVVCFIIYIGYFTCKALRVFIRISTLVSRHYHYHRHRRHHYHIKTVFVLCAPVLSALKRPQVIPLVVILWVRFFLIHYYVIDGIYSIRLHVLST